MTTLITIQEAAKRMSISPKTVYRMINRGKLHRIKVEAATRLSEDEVDAYAQKWKSLKGHESNRIIEMETALLQYNTGMEIVSKDHRVVQAIAMLAKYDQKKIDFQNPRCVSKSWPEFWKFLWDSGKLDK